MDDHEDGRVTRLPTHLERINEYRESRGMEPLAPRYDVRTEHRFYVKGVSCRWCIHKKRRKRAIRGEAIEVSVVDDLEKFGGHHCYFHPECAEEMRNEYKQLLADLGGK